MYSITMATSVPFQGKARSVCFTLNNWVEADQAALRMYYNDGQCRYLVFGREIAPTTGTRHLQGYVAWENPRTLKKFMKLFITKGVHLEKTRGTPKQASEYCKKDGDFEEFGELPAQGERTDWKEVYELVKTTTPGEVLEAYPHLLPYQRSIREAKSLTLKPLHREVNVIVLVGKAGSGKTSWVYNNFTDIYEKPASDWWDHYSGEKVVLMDDFYGWIKYHDLLRVLDRYPYKVPFKGGYVNAQWDTVIITSNKEPDEWYKGGLTPALRRRIKKYILVTSIDGTPTYEEAQLPPSNEEVYEG